MRIAVVMAVSWLIVHGVCAQQKDELEPRIHSMSNEEVLRSFPPSPGEVIQVRANEHDEFLGFLMKVPVTSRWKTISLTNLACTVELPDQPIQPFSMRVLQQGDRASLWLYPVFHGQTGVLEAVEIQLQRFDPKSLDEYIAKERAFVTDYLSDSDIGLFTEWQRVSAHPELSLQEQTEWQTWYRKDIAFKNGDTLRVTARVHKHTVHGTEKDLFPEMDATTRRVIESITPENAPLSADKASTEPVAEVTERVRQFFRAQLENDAEANRTLCAERVLFMMAGIIRDASREELVALSRNSPATWKAVDIV